MATVDFRMLCRVPPNLEVKMEGIEQRAAGREGCLWRGALACLCRRALQDRRCGEEGSSAVVYDATPRILLLMVFVVIITTSRVLTKTCIDSIGRFHCTVLSRIVERWKPGSGGEQDATSDMANVSSTLNFSNSLVSNAICACEPYLFSVPRPPSSRTQNATKFGPFYRADGRPRYRCNLRHAEREYSRTEVRIHRRGDIGCKRLDVLGTRAASVRPVFHPSRGHRPVYC